MQDVRADLEKLRVEAEERELISRLATNPTKKSCSPNWPNVTGRWPMRSSAP